MRFYADGPNIPSELLDARDNGEVVFFCGAGVSMPAGLPSFADLAKYVIGSLGVPNSAPSRRFLERALAEKDPDFAPPMDQVFGLLQREYGTALVEQYVSRRLRTPPKADRSCHEIVLRLSTDVSGDARLVTTNFDLLFESGKSRIRLHVPPALPDLSQEQPLKGLIYLHGRLKGRQSAIHSTQDLILGVADFGRAYLTDGWALRFARELLTRYTVILLGYSADDPPVRYLLEGLHATPAGRPRKIFALSEGEVREVEARWVDRGVTAIPYPKSDERHSALWNTLRAWADRADDPNAWRAGIVELARRRPRAVKPHERGQVAALVRSPVGAKVFADADPPPPAEWLCVFDSVIRYTKPLEYEQDESPEPFDPLDVYGLDDDPPRPSQSGGQGGPPGVDLLTPLSPKERGPNYTRLAGPVAARSDPLPSRLQHLARWISNVACQPATVWWVSGNGALHHTLQDLIEGSIDHERNFCAPAVVKAWRLMFEAFAPPPEPIRQGWHDLEQRVKREGWTRINIRDFERVIRPAMKASRPSRYDPRPPEQSGKDRVDPKLSAMIRFEVQFPPLPEEILDISDKDLPVVVIAVRKGLEHAASLLGDLQETSWRTPTLHPEDKPGERYLSKADAYFLWFAKSFEHLCQRDARRAQRELFAWPSDDPFFFDKLHIWAWMKPEIVSPVRAAEGLLALSSETFWNSYLQRELLWTLRTRWKDFTHQQRRAVEDRLLAGPEQWSEESAEDFARRKAIDAAKRLGWLQLNGCGLSETAIRQLPLLRSADPRWRMGWDQHTDHSYEGRGGWVRTESDPTRIMDASVSDIIERSRQHSKRRLDEFVEYRPFQGLVESRPVQALAALSFEARCDRFPVEFWESALSHWPDSTSSRASWAFANRLARLPKPVLAQLRHYAPRWLHKHLPRMMDEDARQIWPIWDAMFKALSEAGAEVTTSAIGDVTIGGEPQKRSRRTYDHAINSPVGVMTECLVDSASKLDLKKHAGIPAEIKARMERAIGAPGEGSDHAVAVLCRQLRWLHWLDPKWTSEHIIPLFELERSYAEPAWNGLMYDNHLPSPAVFKLIKSAFLGAFSQSVNWHWEDRASQRLSEFLVVATVSSTKRHAYLTFDEARAALQSTDDEARLAALQQLHSMVADGDGWKKVGKPFLERAWPKEAKYQTGETSRLLADIAASAGDDFPGAVRVVEPFLRAADQLDVHLYRMRMDQRDDREPLARRFPHDTIRLLDHLIGDEAGLLPYGLGTVVEMAAEADPSLRQDLRWRRLNDLRFGS